MAPLASWPSLRQRTANHERPPDMLDTLLILFSLVMFLIMFGYVRGCDKLR